MSAARARLLPSTISRLAQVSQQFSSQARIGLQQQTQQQPTLQPLRQQLRMASTTQLKLNTGATIPAVGFGTWQDKDSQEEAVYTALKAGYRHIDTARVYGTEPAVGAGIKKSGIPRGEIFITTKLWNNSHRPEDVEPALDASLRDLDTDYVDLYLMHWPSPFQSGPDLFPKDGDGNTLRGNSHFTDTWQALEAVYRTGKARAIGVSNFSRAELEELLAKADVVPAVHQIEQHPWLAQRDFAAWHAEKGIHVTQYSPFGNQNAIYSSGLELPKLIEDPTLVEIGRKYGKSGAQVALAWGIAHGRTVIPKSKTESRIKDNLAGDFKLDPEDVKKIDGIDKKLRFNDPSDSFKWNFYQDLDGKQK